MPPDREFGPELDLLVSVEVQALDEFRIVDNRLLVRLLAKLFRPADECVERKRNLRTEEDAFRRRSQRLGSRGQAEGRRTNQQRTAIDHLTLPQSDRHGPLVSRLRIAAQLAAGSYGNSETKGH